MTRRLQAHLLIQDVGSALEEGRAFLKGYPNAKSVHKTYLEALCRKGEEVEALEQFSLFCSQDIDPETKRHMTEWLAWGVLDRGKESPLLMVRLYALLGAAFTHDARALSLLLKELRGTNAFLRSLAAKLAASYGDELLQDELLRLLKEEKVWFVRLEVIRAVGALKMEKARAQLKAIVMHPRTLAEERAASILALVQLYDRIEGDELETLLQSPRAGLRQLACEMVGYLDLRTKAACLIPLLQDDSPDVRIAALHTLGMLRIKQMGEDTTFSHLKRNLESVNAPLSITAAWLAMLLHEQEGERKLKQWLEGNDLASKRLAAAALAATGSLGVSLGKEQIQKQEDPYTRVNLALGLIGQRQEVPLACEALFDAFAKVGSEPWMWDDETSPFFRSLVPSQVRHVEQIPHYPALVDQFTKLELLSILSLFKYPEALEEVKQFLRKRDLGLTGMAAVILLQEGGETSLELIRSLLESEDEKVRVQAAYILAMLGGDPKAVAVLMESYPQMDKEGKVHILEALGQIGDPSVVSFLLEVLKEPFQGLRVVAASALIQCLYH